MGRAKDGLVGQRQRRTHDGRSNLAPRRTAALGASLLVLGALGAWVGCSGDASDTTPTTTVPPDAGGGGQAGADAGPASYTGSVGTPTFLGPWGGAASKLAEDPSLAGRVYAIVGGQVFRSTDHGTTWTAAAPVDFGAASLLVLADGTLLVGSELDLLSSTDQGQSFQSIKGNVEQGYGIGIRVTGIAHQDGSPGRLWITLANYQTAPIWTLPDGDTTWLPWSPPAGWAADPLNGVARFSSIDVQPDSGSPATLVFASYEEDFGAGGGVFCSLDSGTTFAACATGLPSMPFHRIRIYDDAVVVAGGQIFGSAFAGLYYSTTHGSSWIQSAQGWSDPIANDFLRLPSGDILAASYGRGIMRAPSLSGAWAEQPGFPGMEVNSLLALASGDLLAGPEQLGVYRSADDAQSWQMSAEGLDLAEVSDSCVDPMEPATVLAAMSSLNSGLVIRTDTGIDGWGVVPALPHPRFNYLTIGDSGRWYVVSNGPTNQANDGVYVSSDGGQSFQFIGPLTGALMDHDIYGVVERQGGNELLVAGQYWADGNWAPFVTQSLDGGQTWSERFVGQTQHVPSRLVDTASGDLFLAVNGESVVHLDPSFAQTTLEIPGVAGGAVIDVAACYRDASNLLAVGQTDPNAYAFSAFVSHDGGGSWTEAAFGAADGEVPLWVASHPYDCNLVLLATSNGRLLSSSDGGQAWSEIALGATLTLALRGLDLVRLRDDYGATLLLNGVGGIVSVPLLTTVQ